MGEPRFRRRNQVAVESSSAPSRKANAFLRSRRCALNCPEKSRRHSRHAFRQIELCFFRALQDTLGFQKPLFSLGH